MRLVLSILHATHTLPKAHERRIAEREELIRHISDKHNIKGYNHSPLEREKVNEFISRLGDLQRRQRSDYEKLQTEARNKNDEYNRKSRQLHTELESLRMQRSNAREQTVCIFLLVTWCFCFPHY